jgi:uncharacterized membrane protein HdeD (DUF308 family)
MARMSIGFGVALIVLGIVAFVGTGSAHKTALIPAYFGAGLVICGAVAMKPALRMHAMHGAVLVALIGALACAGRLVRPLMGHPIDAPAFASQLAMFVLCAVFTALCVRSFIAARRQRKIAE